MLSKNICRTLSSSIYFILSVILFSVASSPPKTTEVSGQFRLEVAIFLEEPKV